MNCHTLVLTTTKTEISKDKSCERITHLINQGLALVEYFGIELDNDDDYVEDDMQAVSEEISYIQIHFHTEQPIDYDSLSEIEVDKLVIDLLAETKTRDIRCYGKDITLYL